MSEEIKLERARRKKGTVTAFLFRENGRCDKTEIDLDEALFDMEGGVKKRPLVDKLCEYYSVPFARIIVNPAWLVQVEARGAYFPDFICQLLLAYSSWVIIVPQFKRLPHDLFLSHCYLLFVEIV